MAHRARARALPKRLCGNGGNYLARIRRILLLVRGALGLTILAFVLTSIACGGNGPLSTGDTSGGGGTHPTAGSMAGMAGTTPVGPTGQGGSSGGLGSTMCGTPTLPNGLCAQGASETNGVCQCQAGEPCVCPGVGCVDPMTDPNNCGTCGMTCDATSTCNGGKCGPAATVLLQPVSGCTGALTIAVNAGTVYYADASHNTINKLGASLPLAMNEMGATSLALQGSDLYWYNPGANTIRKLASASGTPTNVFTPTTTTADLWTMKVDTVGGFLATSDGMSVYVSVGTNVIEVSATTAGGGTPVIVAEDKSGGIPEALALNGTSNIVYPTGLDGRLYAAVLGATPASCGALDAMDNVIMDTCTQLVPYSQGGLFPHFMAVISGTAYWIDFTQVKAQLIPPAGGMVGPLDIVASANDVITTAVATTDTIYFAQDGIVEKTPAAPNPNNNPPIQLARGQMAPTSIGLDGTKVYWATAACAIMSLDR